jgi:hypothetical protein
MNKLGWMITNSTQNIGDDFQCIAARQFIGDIPSEYWIDREKMNAYSGENIRLITNGWYMHEPLNWPPATNIISLLISIHISNTMQKNGRVPSKYMLSKDSVQYLREYAPVGGRDTFTVKELKKAGVKTYFSGCLTMTLKRYSEEKKDYVCLIDPTDELEQFIRQRTSREIVIVHPEKNDWPQNYEERIQKAEEILKLYSEALPSLAMETPVLLLEGKFGDERFEGLKYFVNLCTTSDLYSGKYPLDIEHPRSNPKEYLVLRKNLKKIANAFVNGKLDVIDFEEIDKENLAALSMARKRTIKFNKKNNLESISIKEIKTKIRFSIRTIENLRKG